MKRLVLVLAAVILLAPQSFAGPWIKSLADAQKKAKAGNRYIFVDLFADWCGWCHRMEQEVFPSETFQKATDDMVLLRLNTEDGGDGTKLSQRFNVSSLPTFLVLTPEDSIAGVIHGYAPAKEFVGELQNTRAKYTDFLKRASSENSIANDYQKRFDLALEFTQHFAFPQSEARFRKLTSEAKVPDTIRDRSFFELAVAQVLQNRYADATSTVIAFSKVQSKGEWYERARLLQGQVYWQQGNLMAAANEFRQFKQRFPNSGLQANADQALQLVQQQLTQKK